jgi:signal peptidase II
MSRNRKRLVLLVSLIMIVLLLDQISKQWIIDNLYRGETIEPIPVLSDYFQLTYSQNNGAAFGFLPQAGDLFLVIAIFVVIALIIYYPRIPDEAIITRVATALVCGGALGNVVDRVRHEHVVDFIHYQIPGIISNVSNIADHAIVFGVLLILLDSWLLERNARKQEKESMIITAPETNSEHDNHI